VSMQTSLQFHTIVTESITSTRNPTTKESPGLKQMNDVKKAHRQISFQNVVITVNASCYNFTLAAYYSSILLSTCNLCLENKPIQVFITVILL